MCIEPGLISPEIHVILFPEATAFDTELESKGFSCASKTLKKAAAKLAESFSSSAF